MIYMGGYYLKKGDSMQKYELPVEFERLMGDVRRVKNQGWILSVCGGSRAVGRTFEMALGLSENELEIPDYEGIIEVKAKSIRGDNLYKHINLFSAVPDNYLFEIKRILNTYGYPNRKDKSLKAFNYSFSTTKAVFSRGYFFKLKVDRRKERVVLNVYDKFTGFLIDSDISWSFEMLKEKLYRKLKYLLYAKARRKFEHNELFFHYVDIRFYILRDFESFLKAIENGHIRVTFKIDSYVTGPKYGMVNDHGTSFDIDEDYLEEVFYLYS